MPACWSDDVFVYTSIAQTYGSSMTDGNKCGYDSDSFREAMSDTWYRWIVEDQSIQPKFYTDNSDWNAQYVEFADLPLSEAMAKMDDPPCCQCDWKPFEGVGMGVSAMQLEFSDLRQAYVPGAGSFLGGSALSITQGSSHKEQVWDLITYLTDRSNPYLSYIAERQHSFPPYESMTTEAPWTNSEFDVVREVLKHARPPQYPAHGFPEFGALEMARPFRMLTYDFALLGNSIDEAVSRSCELTDSIMVDAGQAVAQDSAADDSDSDSDSDTKGVSAGYWVGIIILGLMAFAATMGALMLFKQNQRLQSGMLQQDSSDDIGLA